MATKQKFPSKTRARPGKLAEEALWDHALKVLSRRAYSANELKSKLLQRAESPGAAAAVMSKLREYGYTDDEKFAEAFARARLDNQGFGRFRVMRDLQAKRVSSAVAGEAVAKAFAETDEQLLIDDYLARKYRSVKLGDFLQEDKNVASAYRRLRTAGFSSSASLTALKRHGKRTADWEEPPEAEER